MIERDRLARKAKVTKWQGGVMIEALGHSYNIELCDTSVAKLLRDVDTALETLQARIEQSVKEIIDEEVSR